MDDHAHSIVAAGDILVLPAIFFVASNCCRCVAAMSPGCCRRHFDVAGNIAGDNARKIAGDISYLGIYVRYAGRWQSRVLQFLLLLLPDSYCYSYLPS